MLHTHCRRELFQACWKHLLDADFLNTYCHGIVLQCPDGILRRVFPRIFTYSADYPEKFVPFRSLMKILINFFQGSDSDNQRHGLLPMSMLSHAKSLVQSPGLV
jgi:hypothetical protein